MSIFNALTFYIFQLYFDSFSNENPNINKETIKISLAFIAFH